MVPEKDFAGRQSRGSRSYQEDAYAFSDIPGPGNTMEGLLVVVADGMGGHTSGDEASELALESFVAAFQGAQGKLPERFKSSVHVANHAIAEKLKVSPEMEGMGTTLLGAAVTREGVEWISVGDSPLFLWHDNQLKRLNDDHSFRPMLKEMTASGEITAADAAKHPFRNLLRAALTGNEIELLDQSPHPFALAEGDLVLAASDGIQSLSDEQIVQALAKWASSEASVVAARLLQAVIDVGHPKQDNVTIAIVKASSAAFVAHTPTPQQEVKTDTETVTIIMNPFRRSEEKKPN